MKRLLTPALALALAAALVSGACGTGESTAPSTTTTTTVDATTPPTGAGASQPGFGTPADPARAVRSAEIKIGASAMAFDPASVDVKTGETVKFVVTNDSAIEHEFLIGDAATQAEHHTEMSAHAGHGGMTSMADTANGFTLQPNTTKTVAWTFTEAGQVIYGCHVPGHWEAGMRGTVEVSP